MARGAGRAEGVLAAGVEGASAKLVGPSLAGMLAGDDDDVRPFLRASLADAGRDAGPSSCRKIVDRKHPVDKDEQRTPVHINNPRKVWRSRGIERPLWKTACIAHTLR